MNLIGLQTFISRGIQRFLRVAGQSILSPLINAVLYIFIFGYVVGSRIDLIAGVSYLEFVLPGIVMMNIIGGAYAQTAFELYFQRFLRYIDEVLVSPFSYLEMIIGFMVPSIFRGVLVGIIVYAVALLFGQSGIHNIWLFIFYSVSVATIFGLLGLIIALWSESFEQLSIVQTFIITPLTFLGGVFNSITMLPEKMQIFLKFNPFFYFVDGLRYSMIGISESNQAIGLMIIFGLIFVLGGIVWYLFRIGWKIRA